MGSNRVASARPGRFSWGFGKGRARCLEWAGALITERKAPQTNTSHAPWKLIFGLAGNWFLDTGCVTSSLCLELSEPHLFSPLWLRWSTSQARLPGPDGSASGPSAHLQVHHSPRPSCRQCARSCQGCSACSCMCTSTILTALPRWAPRRTSTPATSTSTTLSPSSIS